MGCVLPWITPWGTCRRLGQRRAGSRTGEACTAARGRRRGCRRRRLSVVSLCRLVFVASGGRGGAMEGSARQLCHARRAASACYLSGLCWARIDCHNRHAGPACGPAGLRFCVWSRNLAGCIAELAGLERAHKTSPTTYLIISAYPDASAASVRHAD